MATADDSSNIKNTPDMGPAGEARRWIESAAGEAAAFKNSAVSTANSAVSAAESGLSQALSASCAGIQETRGWIKWMKNEYVVYEDSAVQKTKEGIFLAASHPQLSFGVAAGLGLVVLKRPRSFLMRNTRRLFMSEESLLADAEAKVNKLRQSINLLKNESRKLEERALKAEQEMRRGWEALIKEGREIKGELRAVDRIEKQATGLKDLIRELPRRDASQFRSQLSGLESQVKQEKKALDAAATKIINHGIAL